MCTVLSLTTHQHTSLPFCSTLQSIGEWTLQGCLNNCYLCPSLKDLLCLKGKLQCCLTCFLQWKILWLEGRQCSGHSFAVRATVLFIQREQNLSLGILGRHFSYYVLGIRAVLQNAKCFPLSNQQLQLWFNIVAVNINVGLYTQPAFSHLCWMVV